MLKLLVNSNEVKMSVLVHEKLWIKLNCNSFVFLIHFVDALVPRHQPLELVHHCH